MTKSKKIWLSSVIAVLIVTVGFLFFYTSTIGARQTQLNVRNVELTSVELDYSSIINNFENAKVEKEGTLTTFEGYQTLSASLFEELDNVSSSDVEEAVGCQVKYNFSYDSETNIVTLSAKMVNGDSFELEEIYGAAFINDKGNIDAVMDLDGDYVLLSEMQDMGMIQNCGWFSNLFKKIAKVAVAVVAVAVVCVATAGVGVAACVAIGATVGAAESVATQLIETGTVNVGTLITDTALSAIPGGVVGKNVAKNTAKIATTTAKSATKQTVKSAVKTVASNYSNKLNKELIEALQKESVSADRILARVNKLTSPTNKTWRIVNTNGNKVVDKAVFAKQGANGTVRRINNGEEVADIVQGALVFREKNVSHVIKVSQEISSDVTKNMSEFDKVLRAQVKDLSNNDKAIREIRDYFIKKGKDVKKLSLDDLENYRKTKNLTWHECADKHTVQLVEKTLHNEVSHTGGRFEVAYGSK